MTTSKASLADAEGAAWVARRDRADLGPDEERAFEQWLGADPCHLGAYARAEAVFVTFDRARALRSPHASPAPVYRRRAVLGWAATAAAAALGGVAIVPRLHDTVPASPFAATDRVAHVALPDGSKLVLDVGAAVITRFARHVRSVELVRGSAFFEVAHDASRPFVVSAADVVATAIGTSFRVSRDDRGGGSVMVRMGIVAVQDGAARLLARAQDLVSWTDGGRNGLRRSRMDERDVARQLAWTQGMLAFEGETLAEAVARFARYSSFTIRVADPALGQRRVAGWFSADKPRSFAHAVAASLDARVEDSENGVILRAASGKDRRR